MGKSVMLAKFREWLEVVGLFSVVLSLVFVGLQMKQSQDIAIASQYQARADHNLEITALVLDDEQYLKRLGALARSDLAQLDPQQTVYTPEVLGELSDVDLGRNFLRCVMRHKQLENLQFQWEMGMLEESSWRALRNVHALNVDTAGWCAFTYDALAPFYRSEMKALVEEIRADIGGE